MAFNIPMFTMSHYHLKKKITICKRPNKVRMQMLPAYLQIIFFFNFLVYSLSFHFFLLFSLFLLPSYFLLSSGKRNFYFLFYFILGRRHWSPSLSGLVSMWDSKPRGRGPELPYTYAAHAKKFFCDWKSANPISQWNYASQTMVLVAICEMHSAKSTAAAYRWILFFVEMQSQELGFKRNFCKLGF